MRPFVFDRPELSNNIKLAICKSGNKITRSIYGILNSAFNFLSRSPHLYFCILCLSSYTFQKNTKKFASLNEINNNSPYQKDNS